MGLKESTEVYMGGFGGRKGNGEMMELCYNLKKIKRSNFQKIRCSYRVCVCVCVCVCVSECCVGECYVCV